MYEKVLKKFQETTKKAIMKIKFELMCVFSFPLTVLLHKL